MSGLSEEPAWGAEDAATFSTHTISRQNGLLDIFSPSGLFIAGRIFSLFPLYF
jgi:hypothetical protein